MLVYENKARESQLKKLFKSSESSPLPQTDTSFSAEETLTDATKEKAKEFMRVMAELVNESIDKKEIKEY